MQKISAMNQNGADEPKCTDREKEDVGAYDGLWKATSYGCEKDDLNNDGIRINKELNEGLSTLYLNITNDQVLYEIKYIKTNEKFSTCLSNVTERWSVRNNQLTVSDTVQTIFKVGTFIECQGNKTVKKARIHHITLNQDTFKIVLTGEVPSPVIKICKASAMSIQFKKVDSYQ